MSVGDRHTLLVRDPTFEAVTAILRENYESIVLGHVHFIDVVYTNIISHGADIAKLIVKHRFKFHARSYAHLHLRREIVCPTTPILSRQARRRHRLDDRCFD